MEQMSRNKSGTGLFSLVICTALIEGCTSNRETPQQRAEAAKLLFQQTATNFHIPSAEAAGAEKTRLQAQAAAGYQELLNKFPDQKIYAAQAERSLGNILATEGKIDEAVRHYGAVASKYPAQEWEVLMAWKSAADLLWESGRKAEAAQFYKK